MNNLFFFVNLFHNELCPSIDVCLLMIIVIVVVVVVCCWLNWIWNLLNECWRRHRYRYSESFWFLIFFFLIKNQSIDWNSASIQYRFNKKFLKVLFRFLSLYPPSSSYLSIEGNKSKYLYGVFSLLIFVKNYPSSTATASIYLP